MKKISDRERVLEQSSWVGDGVVSRSDYLARLGLKAGLVDGDHPARRTEPRSLYAIAILLCSAGMVGVVRLIRLQATT